MGIDARVTLGVLAQQCFELIEPGKQLGAVRGRASASYALTCELVAQDLVLGEHSRELRTWAFDITPHGVSISSLGRHVVAWPPSPHSVHLFTCMLNIHVLILNDSTFL